MDNGIFHTVVILLYNYKPKIWFFYFDRIVYLFSRRRYAPALLRHVNNNHNEGGQQMILWAMKYLENKQTCIS